MRLAARRDEGGMEWEEEDARRSASDEPAVVIVNMAHRGTSTSFTKGTSPVSADASTAADSAIVLFPILSFD